MRECKYRAWDKIDNKMKDVVSIDFSTKTLVLYYFDYESKEKLIEVSFVRKFKDCILLEYTDLRDRKRTEEYPNGQQVCEGDVLEFKYTLYNGKDIIIKCPVTYSMGEFGVIIDEILASDYFSLGSLVGEIGQEFEIVGNIYDNPELLEK